MADTIAVKLEGKIAEYGSAEEAKSPAHTERMLHSVPALRTVWLGKLESTQYN